MGIARAEGITLRQRYTFTLKKLNVLLRFQHTKQDSAAARKARKKIKTIAGRFQRELCRKLSATALVRHHPQLDIYRKILHQKRSDNNKIFSLHEPEVKCYTKGMAHKKFELSEAISRIPLKAIKMIMSNLAVRLLYSLLKIVA